MRDIFQSGKCLGTIEWWMKFNRAARGFYQAWLAWGAEELLEAGVDGADRFNGMSHDWIINVWLELS